MDTITITMTNVPVGSWDLPLTLSPVTMSITDPCNPVGIVESGKERPKAWPVPARRGELLFVEGVAAGDPMEIIAADGRRWGPVLRSASVIQRIATNDLSPGPYSLRIHGSAAVLFVVVE